MKGDFSRLTYRPGNHYSSVRMQQGRVLLDADWNEQADLGAHLERTTDIDVIGTNAAPKTQVGSFENFFVQVDGQGGDLRVGPGRIYVDGILCENDDPAGTLYTAQPDLPGAAVPTADGDYAVYLDVWERHITAVDQYGQAFPPLLESALGGPDTTTRTRVICQVKLAAIQAMDCGAFTPPAPPTGQLRASESPSGAPPKDRSVPRGGYQRLENHLYRVEVHDVAESGPVFVWARDNASVVSKVTVIDTLANTIVVADPGRDDIGFGAANWIELTDEERTLRGESGSLLAVTTVRGSTVTFANPAGLSLAVGTNPTLRRWDGVLTMAANTATEVEDGMQVEIDANTFEVGDYWMVPARTTTGKVEWPQDAANPPASVFQTRHGTMHHYCALAVVAFSNGTFSNLVDCRRQFAPLSAITASDVSYDPSKCDNLAGTTTVQQALDTLCRLGESGEEDGLRIQRVEFLDGSDLRNDALITSQALAGGIRIALSDTVFQDRVRNEHGLPKPICRVTLDLPWPTNPPERETWQVPASGFVGVTTITLAADVNTDGNEIFWLPQSKPPADVKSWLADGFIASVGVWTHGQIRTVLARLTLEGNYIGGPDEEPERAVDGDLFGTPGADHVDVRLPSGNRRRGGNFEMWFWLAK